MSNSSSSPQTTLFFVSSVASAIPISPPLPNTSWPLAPQPVSFLDTPPLTRVIGVSTSQLDGLSSPVMLSSTRIIFRSALTPPVSPQALWIFFFQVLLRRCTTLPPWCPLRSPRRQSPLSSRDAELNWRSSLRTPPSYRLARSFLLARLLLLQPVHLYGSTFGGVLVLPPRLLSRLLHHCPHQSWRCPRRRPLFCPHQSWRCPRRRPLFQNSRLLLQLWQPVRHLLLRADL